MGLVILPNVLGRVSDPMSGYFMVRRSAITGPRLNPLGYKILFEVIGRYKVNDIAEVGYVFQERITGESKVTWHQHVDYLLHLVRLRSQGRFSQLKRNFSVCQLLRFRIVGFSGVLVDIVILYLLSEPKALGWRLTRSKIIASDTVIFNNFILNDAWTFSDISQHQKGWVARIKDS